jgi:predicted permease
MWKIDLGFEPNNMVEVWINMPRQYTGPQTNVLAEKIVDAVKTGSNAESVSLALPGPFSRLTYDCGGALVDGVQTSKASVFVTVVTPEYFRTMKIPVMEGRGFNSSDIAGGPRVLVANQAAVRQYFHGTSPLTHHVTRLCGESSDFEVIGVAKDVRFNNPLQEPQPMLYYLLSQSDQMVNHPIRILEVRGSGPGLDPYRIRRLIESTSGAVVIQHSESMITLIDRAIELPQFVARLAGFFGVLGLLLAGVGLYGLIAHSVRQRTSEIGIRMALGAQRSDILWMVLRDAMTLAGIGIATGLVLSLAATQFLGSQLFGVAGFDAVTAMFAIALQILVAGVATYLPAWRASRVDPIVSLRYE